MDGSLIFYLIMFCYLFCNVVFVKSWWRFCICFCDRCWQKVEPKPKVLHCYNHRSGCKSGFQWSPRLSEILHGCPIKQPLAWQERNIHTVRVPRFELMISWSLVVNLQLEYQLRSGMFLRLLFFYLYQSPRGQNRGNKCSAPNVAIFGASLLSLDLAAGCSWRGCGACLCNRLIEAFWPRFLFTDWSLESREVRIIRDFHCW